jgi:shikimate dehydrogenase
MILYGLIGNPLTHSFSARYFRNKFKLEAWAGYEYRLFPLDHIGQLTALIDAHPELKGLNVTIPYKTEVIPYLDEVHNPAMEIDAVNTISILRDGETVRLIGYNTDADGFLTAYGKWLTSEYTHALILGTGGSALAVAYVLRMKGIRTLLVSRNPLTNNVIGYDQIEKTLHSHSIVINATPVGMFPKTDEYPDFPYHTLTPRHLLIDLIYNPEKTVFLQKAEYQGATILNGMEMLHAQAEKAWEIWQKQ